jgi:hypothetical protein
MPKIPMYEQQISTPRGGHSLDVSSPETYMPFANEVSRTGAMLEQRGASLLQEYDTTRAYTAFNELRDKSRNKMAELLSREGIQAQGAQQEYTEFYKKSTEDVAKNSINAFSQRQLFDKLSKSHEQGDLDNLARHEYVEHKKYKTTVVNGYIATTERDIRTVVNDDAKMDAMIYGSTGPDGQVVPGLWGAIDALGSGLDRTQAKLEATQSARYAAMDELINTNPQRATIKLEDWKNELGEKYAPLKKRLEAQNQETMLGSAFSVLNDRFGSNHEAKISFVNNAANWPKLGPSFSYKEAKELDARFSGMAADRERLIKRNEDALEKQQKDNAAAVLQSLYNPDAPRVNVHDLHKRRLIDNATYEHAIKARESTTIDNPWVVTDLHEKAERGIDLTTDIRTAVDNGSLSEKSAASIGKHATDEKSKRAMQYIDRALKPSEADQWSPDKHLKYADATRLYYAKIKSGMDYEDAAAEVVRGYIDGIRRTLRMLPTPEGLTHEQKTDLAALENAKLITAEKLRKSRITPEVYREQMNSIDNLIKIAIEEQNAAGIETELDAIRKRRLAK